MSAAGSGTDDAGVMSRSWAPFRSGCKLPLNVITWVDASAVKVPIANWPTPPSIPVPVCSVSLLPAVAVVGELAVAGVLPQNSNS